MIRYCLIRFPNRRGSFSMLSNLNRITAITLATGIATTLCGAALGATQGRVIDLNGAPVGEAMVTLTKASGASGPTATTVFTNEHGEFAFAPDAPSGTLSVRSLGHRQLQSEIRTGNAPISILMRSEA